MILSITLFIITLLNAMFLSYCNNLTDYNINGFTGIAGIIKLNFNGKYTKLTDEPLQILINRDYEEEFEETYFDSNYRDGYWEGYGIRDNITYKYNFRAFTSNYAIVTIEEKEDRF